MTPAGHPAGVRVAASCWRSSHHVAEAGVLLVVAALAANFIVVKATNQQIPPIAFAFLRFATAATVLLLSPDRGFDTVPGLRRIDPASAATGP